QLERRLWRLLAAAFEGQLVALEDRPALRRRQLQRPSFPGAAAQGDTPPREAQVRRVVVDGLEAKGLRRRDGDALGDSGEVREVEPGAGPELHLTFKHSLRRAPRCRARSRSQAP